MSFLKKYYNHELDTSSPVQKSFDLVSDFSDGVEVKSFVETDYPKIVESHGSVIDWSLDSLMKAGINPNFPVHTGSSGSRVEGISSVIDSINSNVDSILGENAE